LLNFNSWRKESGLIFHFKIKWARYGNFNVSRLLTFKTKILKSIKWPYLAHCSSNWKNKTTLFYLTLKVEEKKVVLIFHFKLKWARYGHFYVSHFFTFKTKILKSRKWPYLAHFSSKWKNKTTLFSLTFKVEEKKVVLFFHFRLKWGKNGYFLDF